MPNRRAEQLKLWKMLAKPSYQTGAEYCRVLGERGYRLSDWILDVVQKDDFPIHVGSWPLPLVRISLHSVGCTGPTTLENFYRSARNKGFETCPPAAALALRLVYDEQPTGEWLRVAIEMDQMVDSDGVPHLPKLGAALKRYYLETYWAYPHAIFHPHNEFVMVDRRLKGEKNASARV